MQDMNTNAALATIGIVVLIGLGVYAATRSSTTPVRTPTTTQQENAAPQGKLMSIESYVTHNISALSPEKETLGGTFYVTEISVDSEKKTGHVKYEDGHNAYEADFSYTAADQTGINITSFVIRK